ncbi:hypothetical protein BY996DRAFT_6717694 [Phakopsora pachyrhizi]|nr:hypothetical protein BY996DRAFT_6717694 [Phakopsora pachyrhizi]
MLIFARYYGKEAQSLLSKAVDVGPLWYPWALASINITWWCQFIYLFHCYWRRLNPSPTMMEFEERFEAFKASVAKGLMKGLVSGLDVG